MSIVRQQDTRQFASAEQIDQLEGLAVARSVGVRVPLPHQPSFTSQPATAGKPASELSDMRRLSAVAPKARRRTTHVIQRSPVASRLSLRARVRGRLERPGSDVYTDWRVSRSGIPCSPRHPRGVRRANGPGERHRRRATQVIIDRVFWTTLVFRGSTSVAPCRAVAAIT